MNKNLKNNLRKNSDISLTSGYVIIINTLIFMTITTILLAGVVNPILSHYVSAKGFTESKKSFQLANSATEEVMYRLRTNKNLPSSASITLDTGTANISVADSYKEKEITVNAETNGYERNINMNIIQDVGVSFSYGLQAGNGGVSICNNCSVIGNVYSNGDVVGNGTGQITGSVTVSNSSNPTANQSNPVGATTTDINFGGTSTSQDFAQSFQISTTTDVTSIGLYIKKSSLTGLNNITLRITTNDSSEPSKTSLTTTNISASTVSTEYSYIKIPLPTNLSLSIGTTYWIVLDASVQGSAFYSVGASTSTYANGIGKVGTWNSSNGGTWNNTSPSGLDAYFDIYVGGEFGLISGVEIGENGIGDAYAHEVEDSKIAGDLYCQSGTNNKDFDNNTMNCDTSRTDPVEQPFPISDGNIQDWKNLAQSGGTLNGDQTYNSSTTYLGPKKIDGDLTVKGTLNMTGTIWVTGNIDLSSGGVIQLDPTYGASSGVIVVDGIIEATGGGQFLGTDTEGSYILVVSTSDASPAIKVTGGSGSVVLNAQKGSVEFSGGASAKEATANRIVLTGGASVEYETGLASLNFSGGPSGSWYVSSWDEVE